MGLLSGLVTAPLAPVRGVLWVGRQIVEAAEAEYYDIGVITQQLADLERDLVEGRIDETEFDQAEDELLDRLEEARRRAATTAGRPGEATGT